MIIVNEIKDPSNPTRKLIMPKKAYKSDAGFDVYSPGSFIIPAHGFEKIGLSIRCNIPDNHTLLVQGRSGLAFDNGIFTIGNVIDKGYSGEIHACLANLSDYNYIINPNDRIAQLLLIPISSISKMNEVVSENVFLSTFDEDGRGSDGQGSSGR